MSESNGINKTHFCHGIMSYNARTDYGIRNTDKTKQSTDWNRALKQAVNKPMIRANHTVGD